MKEKFKGIIIGLLLGTTLTSGAVFAKNAAEKITVYYRNIKVYKDKVPLTLKDSNGTTVEPFIYNGTAYLPLKAAAAAAGLSTTWDGKTNSIYIWDKVSSGNKFLLDVCPPYQTEGGVNKYLSSESKSFSMGGQNFSNGIVLHNNNGWDQKGKVFFNLNCKYSSMSFDIGHFVGNGHKGDSTVSFVVDGETVKQVTVDDEALPRKVTVPLNYGGQLKITYDGGYVGLGNITVK